MKNNVMTLNQKPNQIPKIEKNGPIYLDWFN